jgi:heat shock protein HslJ
MRSGCRLLVVASLCAFITAPIPAQENTEQPIHKPTSLEIFSIENHRWRIAKYRADDGQQTDKDGLIDAWAEITFQGSSVSGSPPCGGWGGSYKLSGRRIDVDVNVILLGLCPPETWSQSLAIVKAFKGELSIEKAGDEILLRGKDGRARVRLVPIGLPLPIGFPPSGPTK